MEEKPPNKVVLIGQLISHIGSLIMLLFLLVLFGSCAFVILRS
jgi:hypothetical protein